MTAPSSKALQARYRRASFWLDDLVVRGVDDLVPRPGLSGDRYVDVCIVGAGFTGLWAALAIKAEAPELQVAVVEAEIAGFGASGRNGGWCSALFPLGDAELVRLYGMGAARAMRQALHAAVTEVGEHAARLGIDCDYRAAGTSSLIRSPAAREAADREVAGAALLGVDRPQERDDGALGPRLFEPMCASIHPAKLARGLARAAEAAGVTIWERSRALSWGRNTVTCETGTITCDRLVVATEAWGATLPSSRRRVLPLYSLMVATEPLPDATWDAIGLAPGETVGDFRKLLVYGQRTASGRLAFGGRGARYHLGGSIRDAWDRSRRVHQHLARAIGELFPAARDAAITHRWGGPIGVPRDWHPSVLTGHNGATVWAGGYVGDGVAASHLAGRTAADLVLERRTERTALPWVGHRSPKWEPEPLRFIAVNAVTTGYAIADQEERRTGRVSRVAGLIDGVIR